MDAKALAKSKRAHSQHHKSKSHSYQKSKAPAVASGNTGSKEKQPGKQVEAETHQSRHTSRLPSNWDRYEDEFDLDSENPYGDSTSQASDIIVPKSKGADYHHLIAEAQSQTRSLSYSYSDTFPSFDDVMPGGVIQGLGSILQIRGEGILSWAEDDNFIVEDKTTAFQEASFLSLNLNALAEQLAKVDLSHLLFVEADLLPSEQGAEGSVASGNREYGQMQAKCESETVADISKDRDITFDDFSKGEEEPMAHRIEAATNMSVDIAKDDLNYSQFDKQSKASEPIDLFNDNSIAVSKNLPKFEAATLEAELDVLLDTFGGTRLFDSSGSKSSATFSVSQQIWTSALPQPDSQIASSVTASFDNVLDDLLEETSNNQLLRKERDSSKTASVAASFDDVLDDLLEETSNLTKQNQLLRKEPDSSNTASVTASLDDVLDDLLDKTSYPMNPNGLSQSQDVKVIPHETQSSSSQSVAKSKVLDDFDSWLDG